MYDALNVFSALGIVLKDKNKVSITWEGTKYLSKPTEVLQKIVSQHIDAKMKLLEPKKTKAGLDDLKVFYFWIFQIFSVISITKFVIS